MTFIKTNIFSATRSQVFTSAGLRSRFQTLAGSRSTRAYSSKEAGINDRVIDFSNRHYKNILVVSGALGIGVALFSFHSPLFRDDRLNLDDFIKVKLLSKTQLTPDTTLYRFQYPDKTSLAQAFSFPVISHVHVKDHNMQIMRPYTTIPVATETILNENGGAGLINKSLTIDLAVKRYHQGPMSNFLSQIGIGGEVEMRGPYQTWNYEPNKYRLITLIAAGTGIAPFYQLVRSALQEQFSATDKTRFSLIYYSHGADSVIFKDELLELQKRFPEKLSITFSITGTPDAVEKQAGFLTGRVSYPQLAELLKKDRFDPSDSKVLVCGPDGFLRNVCGQKAPNDNQGPVKAILAHMGLDSASVFKL